MSKTIVYEVEAMFGDCDPAGIVFFPNFLKWMDASSHNFFIKCGLPPFRELEARRTDWHLRNPLRHVVTCALLQQKIWSRTRSDFKLSAIRRRNSGGMETNNEQSE